MNNYDILNFILLTIILALIIHIVLKNTYSNKKKINNLPFKINEIPNIPINNMNDNSINNMNDNLINSINDNTYTTKIKEIMNTSETSHSYENTQLDENITQPDKKITQSDENTDFELLVGNTTWNTQFDNGIITTEDKQTDDFFNEYVFFGRTRIDKSNLSDKLKVNYRDNYFNFRDNIWTMPNHDNDGIDKINDITLAENEGQMNVNQNKSIKDIYDSLTTQKFPSGEMNNINSFYDTIGTGGQNSSVNLYTYNDDNVSNGHEYFNGVYANNNSNDELFNL